MSQPLELTGLCPLTKQERKDVFTLAVPSPLALSALLLEAWRPGLGGVVSLLPRGTAGDKGAWGNSNANNNNSDM